MGLLSNLLLPGRLRTGPTVVVPAKTKPEAILEIVRLADPQAELDGADVLAAATRIHDAVELTPDLQKKLGLDGEEKLWAHRVVAERPLPVDYYDKLLAAGLAYRLGGYCLCEGSADDPAEDVELEYVVYLPAVEESELTPALEKILGTEEDADPAAPDTESSAAATGDGSEISGLESESGVEDGQRGAIAKPEGDAGAAGTGAEPDAAESESAEAAADTTADTTAASSATAAGSGASSSEGAAGPEAESGEAAGGASEAATGDDDKPGDVATGDDIGDTAEDDLSENAQEGGAESASAAARRSRWSSDGVYEAAGFRVSVTPVHRFPAAVAGLMPYATEVVRIAVSATEELDGDARMLDPGNVALALGTALDGPVVDHWGFQVFEPADLLPPRSV
ncbi:hypothetical protein [Herbidospora sp. NBRC 101105]|uniref:hypothetical protein n=1 Tax=Herbidospora sp. NBRC 101105 TaxID=3032195 RepID=UPI0024A1A6CE|nr:hypothetical protein [Herbidospora sp. NBRC 101105]GLX95771.1 hypothetical protein Hesp01_37210 [Herbidospora sp. NBRC 101105]